MPKTLKSFAELKTVEKEMKTVETKPISPLNIIRLNFSVTHLNAGRVGLRVVIPGEYITAMSDDGKTCPPFYVPHSNQANVLFWDRKAPFTAHRSVLHMENGTGIVRFSCDDYEKHVGLFGMCEGELDLDTGYVTLPERRPIYKPRNIMRRTPRVVLSDAQIAALNIDPAERLRVLRDEMNSILGENAGKFSVEIEDDTIKIFQRRVIKEAL